MNVFDAMAELNSDDFDELKQAAEMIVGPKADESIYTSCHLSVPIGAIRGQNGKESEPRIARMGTDGAKSSRWGHVPEYRVEPSKGEDN